MEAFVLVLYNTDLTKTVDATNRLHTYTNLSVKFDFSQKKNVVKSMRYLKDISITCN